MMPSRRRAPWCSSLLLAIGLSVSSAADDREIATAPDPPPPAGSPGAFGEVVDVSLRTVYVTVTRHGRPVLDLAREDFSLHAEGRTLPILTFERGDVPFTAVLVVDLSASMSGEPATLARTLVTSFARLLGPNDEVQLVGFGGAVAFASPLGSSPSTLLASLATLPTVAPGSAPYDALATAGALLSPRLGRKVLILVSDGIDLHSAVEPSRLATALRTRGILLDWIRPAGDTQDQGRGVALPGEEARLQAAMARLPPASSWRPPRQAATQREALDDLVASSGGRVLALENVGAVQAALAEILTHLRSQYVLGYSCERGRPALPEVRLRRPDHLVRVAGA